MIVRHALVADPLVLQAGAPVREVAAVLTKPNVVHVLVVDDDRLVGSVTEEAVVAAVAEGLDLRELTAGDLADPDVPTVGPDTPLDEAILLMGETSLERMAVVEDGRLLGILPREPVVRRLAEDEPPPEPDEDLAAGVGARRRGALGALGQLGGRERGAVQEVVLARPRARPGRSGAASRTMTSPPATITGARSGCEPAQLAELVDGERRQPLDLLRDPAGLEAVAVDELRLLLGEAEVERRQRRHRAGDADRVRRAAARREAPRGRARGTPRARSRPAGPSAGTARSGARSRGRGSGASPAEDELRRAAADVDDQRARRRGRGRRRRRGR